MCAAVVELRPWRSGGADGADDLIAEFDHHAAAEEHNMRQFRERHNRILAFCALAALVATGPKGTERSSATANSETPKPETLYTRQDVDRLVKEALEKQQPPQPVLVVQSPKPVKTPTQLTHSRRPLTRAEREQLAADLRLLSTPEDDVDLNLLGERINNQ